MKQAAWLAGVGMFIAAAAMGQNAAPPAQPPAAAPAEAPKPRGVELIQQQAGAMRQLARTEPAWRFLESAGELPRIEPRTVLRDPATRALYSEAAAAKLPEEARAALKKTTLDEHFYYTTKYGSPLAFTRPLEVLGTHGAGGLEGKRILDFGYGGIGHLRMLAAAGADAVGVDVDPLLPVLYSSPGDQGTVKGRRGVDGRVMLVDGRWPAEESARGAVGGGYDLIISKNTLKNGYIHPAQPVDKRMLVDLGVEDAEFVKALFAAVKPGGWVLVYNLCPAPAPPDKPYIPWADGRSPFPREMWEGAGFKVVAFDAKDDEAARAVGKALGWDKDGMDLEKDLFAWYTLVQKPVGG